MSALLHTVRPVEVQARETRPEAPRTDDPADWRAWFDRVYAEAAGDASRVPWADLRPNPALLAWMNGASAGLVRPGACVTVVGCGLGDDVRELADRGFDATGFDVSPVAIEWARRRHPAIAERLQVADLLDLPASLKRRADLVVEISTIQAVHPALRERLAAGVASLARPRGVVLAICRGCGESVTTGSLGPPPYPLTCAELSGLFSGEGFTPVREIDDFEDDETPPVRMLRAALKRA